MEKIKIALSTNLRTSSLYEYLKSFLEKEKQCDKNGTRYDQMIEYSSYEIEECLQKYENVCFLVTDFTYKTHFQIVHEEKRKKQRKQMGLSVELENVNINEEQEQREEYEKYLDKEETELSPKQQLNKKEKKHVALIFLLLQEKYIEEQQEEGKNAFEIIKKLKDHWKETRIICLLVGIRERINSTLIVPELRNMYTTSEEKDKIFILSNVQLNQFITTLLVQHKIDCVEFENVGKVPKFLFTCCKYIHQAKVRKANSYFKYKPSGLVPTRNLNRNEDQEEENDKLNEISGKEESTEKIRTTDPDMLDVIWISQLMQICGISEDISKTIAQQFKSPYHLMKYLIQYNDEDCLKDITINSTYGERKLGKALSKKIYKVFAPNADADNLVS